MTGNQAKYLSYVEAWRRINAAIEGQFYFEAVTICESIISDRLLSYVSGIDPKSKLKTKTSFAKVIAEWRRIAGTLPSDPRYGDVGAAVDAWRIDRNSIVHGLVKSTPGTPTQNVSVFLNEAKRTATEGKRLAREVSHWHKAELRRAKKRINPTPVSSGTAKPGKFSGGVG